MNRIIVRLVLATVPAAALVACGGGGAGDTASASGADDRAAAQAAKPTTSTQTAQAIWSDFGAASTEIVITENRKFDFQPADFCQGTDVTPPVDGVCAEGTTLTPGATSYFAAPVATGPAVTCNGSPTNCASTNQPTIPSVPAAPTEALLDQVKCALWYGEVLPTATTPAAVTVAGANGRGNWTFTWTYSLAPLDAATAVAVHSGYGYKVLGDGGTLDVALDGFVYGQSAQSLAKGTRKYSFSMRASDGSTRVVNTAISVLKDGVPLVTFSQADGTLATLLQENNQANNDYLPVDFLVPQDPTSAGTGLLALRNYDLGLLTFGIGARDILNNTGGISKDNFVGNDNGGADGSALARVKLMPSTPLAVSGGTYAVSYTGQVKELNADGTLQGFTVNREIKVVGEPGTCKRN